MKHAPSYSDNLYSDIQPSYTDVLVHHGIKGMKWGVRRPRNEDGIIQGAGAKLAAEMKARKQKLKEDHANKKQARAEKRANFRKSLTSDEAKERYKKIAKGAAIAGGLAGAAAIASVGAEEVKSHQNYKKAQGLADEVLKDNFTDLSDAERQVVRRNLVNANNRALNRQDQVKGYVRKQQAKDAVNAYLNPKQASKAARDSYREARREGKYSTDTSKMAGIGTIDSSNIGQYEKGLRRAAEQAVNPTEFERKKRNARLAAEKKHQEEVAANEAKNKDTLVRMAKKIKEDEEKKEARMKNG